jgi:hypothetical protein
VLFVLDLVQIVDSSGIATTRHAIFPNGSQYHALPQAFLEPAILASIPLRFGYLAIAVGDARVDPFVLHSSFEESFAAFASNYTVV